MRLTTSSTVDGLDTLWHELSRRSASGKEKCDGRTEAEAEAVDEEAEERATAEKERVGVGHGRG